MRKKSLAIGMAVLLTAMPASSTLAEDFSIEFMAEEQAVSDQDFTLADETAESTGPDVTVSGTADTEVTDTETTNTETTNTEITNTEVTNTEVTGEMESSVAAEAAADPDAAEEYQQDDFAEEEDVLSIDLSEAESNEGEFEISLDDNFLEDTGTSEASMSEGESAAAAWMKKNVDVDALAAEFRKDMVKREETFGFTRTIEITGLSNATEAQNAATKIMALYKQALDQIYSEIFVETGNSDEGDYLLHHLRNNSTFGTTYENQRAGYSQDGKCYVKFDAVSTYHVTYNSTYEQEQQVAKKVQSVLSQLGVASMSSEYEKAKAIYTWICSNVTYDYTNLNNSAYYRKFSAYAALFDKTAVCQGYGTLLYRMFREAGIDVRIVTGTANGGSGTQNHMWNVAMLDGNGYLLDSTWDSSYKSGSYQYMVPATTSYAKHTPDAESLELTKKYIKTTKKTVTEQKLAAPAGLKAAISTGSSANAVSVTWNKVSGASKYRIYRKAGSGSYKKLADVTTTSYKDTGVASGTTYTYIVKCVSSDGKTVQSDASTKSITVLARPAVKAVNAAKGVTISWKKISGATGYYVYRNGSKLTTISKGTTVSYTDTRAANGGTYTYTVQAYSKTAKSIASAGAKILRVSAPSISSLTNSASKKMTVKWSKNTKATGYQIQYATNRSFSGAKTITVRKGTTVSQVISSLVKNKTYYVRVRTYVKRGSTTTYSTFSAAKSLKIKK